MRGIPPSHLDSLCRRLADFPVVALLGPRQVGKTSLARQLAAIWDGSSALLDREDPDHLARLADPRLPCVRYAAWCVHTGGELDLLILRGTKRIGFEV